MDIDVSKSPPPLPTPRPKQIRKGITLLPPLSRKGTGPGLILLTSKSEDNLDIKDGVPSLLIKWAEEGYTVIEAQLKVFFREGNSITMLLNELVGALEKCEEFESAGGVGIISYEEAYWQIIGGAVKNEPRIVAASVYTSSSVLEKYESHGVPTIQHITGPPPQRLVRTPDLTQYSYPDAASCFATPFTPHFDYTTEAVSHTRNLTFFKKVMGGPNFDLEAIWDEHTAYEFGNRSVEWTMSTMVQEPYVNHIPTMTGGIGRAALTDFYTNHFIFSNPSDARLELISRTVGMDRVVDEFIFNVSHTSIIPWLVPGIPPTNKKLAIPMTAIVCVRGDRLYHEHISWDQGTVLKQLGLMPEFLPFQYEVHGMHGALEVRVPVAGVETAEKARDRNQGVSNGMFGGNAVRGVKKD